MSSDLLIQTPFTINVVSRRFTEIQSLSSGRKKHTSLAGRNVETYFQNVLFFSDASPALLGSPWGNVRDCHWDI